MKSRATHLLFGLVLAVFCHCGGGVTDSDTCCDDNTPNSSACSLATTWGATTVALTSGASIVSSAAQIYTLTAAADKKIAAYLINESSTEPSSSDSGWTSITQTTDLSATNISHVLADTADGGKTVYAWFKDECGDVSPSANTSFTLDATAPAGTLSLNSGAKFTLESELDVTAALSATDADGIVAYALTDTNTEPAVDSIDWVSVASTTSLSISTTRTLPHDDRANTVYGWVKDVAGHVSAVSDEIEVMRVNGISSGASFGQFTSISIDVDGNPFISSDDITHTEMFYAYFFNGSIASSTVDSVGNIANGTAIATDSNGNQHIAYRDEGNGKLKYTTNASGSWVLTTIEDGGRSPNIAIDSHGFVHITHRDDADVKYVTNITGSWVSTTAYTDGNFNTGEIYLNMTLDNADHPHLLYNAFDPSQLMHITNASGSWLNEVIYAYAGFPKDGASISTNGTTLVVAFSKDNGKFYFTEKPLGGSWSVPTQVDDDYGRPSSIEADSNGYLHIVYYFTLTRDLKYATNLTGEWIVSTIDSTGDVGNYCDLAIDANDKLHISYYDVSNTDLKYATTADAL